MILNKALLLKCLGGVAACLGTASLAVVGSEKIASGNVSSESKTELNKLLEKVGLSGCTTENNTSECSISNLKVKYESGSGEENKTKQSDSSGTPGKIKVYSDDTYSNKFKFVIEDGDITLTGGTGSQITKLEQFETYEIKKEDSSNNWFLTRKTKASEGIKTALGLPEGCNLPETTDASSTTPTCTINTTDISKVKFDGENPNPSSSGEVTLTITKLSTSEEDFPFDYKFGFKASSSSDSTTLNINSKQITLQQNTATEFKIKKPTTGNNITLEEAWTKERLLEKVDLNCTDSNECTLKSGKSINIKFEDNDKLENKTLGTSNVGKIKLYTGDQTSDYNHGFKFVIEEKDISITEDSAKKLEQFETYEIKDEGTGTNKKWYFSRKKKAEDEIKRLLGLPSNGTSCTLPTSASDSTTCSNISGDDLKNINFKDKDNNQPSITNSGTVTLTISKVSDTTTFPLGYKFAFDPTEEVTISSSNKIAKKSGTEFKIKVTQSSGTTPVSLALEKAWTVTTLAAKVGLNCPDPSNNGEKKCSFTNDSINVKGDDSKKVDGAKLKDSDDSSGKKMSYLEDQEGHNQGFKFTVDGSGCIELSKDGSDDTTIPKIENNGNSYEIKEDAGTWYLTKYTPTSS